MGAKMQKLLIPVLALLLGTPVFISQQLVRSSIAATSFLFAETLTPTSNQGEKTIWVEESNGSQNKASPEKKIIVAVLTLRHAEGITPGETEIITDRLRTDLFNTGKVNIMAGDQMQRLLGQQNGLQPEICDDQTCMVKIGRILGVDQLITGSIGKVGAMFLINLRVIDIQSGEVIRVLSRDINGMDVVVAHIPEISMDLVGLKPPTPALSQPPITTTEAPLTDTSKVDRSNIKPNPPTIEQKPNLAEAVPVQHTSKFGLRFQMNTLIGETWWYYTDSTGIKNTINENFDTVVSWPVINPQLMLLIQANSFLAYEIGFGYGWWKQNFTLTRNSQKWQYVRSNSIISLAGGIDLIKRFQKLHLTAGALLSANSFSYEIKVYINDAIQNSGNSISNASAINLSIGVHAGLEFMIDQHWWINGNIIAQYSQFSYTKESTDYIVKLPWIGLGAGGTYYF